MIMKHFYNNETRLAGKIGLQDLELLGDRTILARPSSKLFENLQWSTKFNLAFLLIRR